MRCLIYHPGASPTARARALAAHLEREGGRVGFRRVERWAGEVERAGRVYAARPDVRAAYEAAGVEAHPLKEAPLEEVGARKDVPQEEPLTSEYAQNGYWRIERGGEVLKKGRGQASYEAALEEYGLTPEG